MSGMFLLNKPIHVDNLYFSGIVWWVSNDLWSYYMVVLDTPANGRYLPIIAKPISLYLDYQKDNHQKVTLNMLQPFTSDGELELKKIKEWTESPYLIMEDPKYNFGSLDIIQVCFLNWIFIMGIALNGIREMKWHLIHFALVPRDTVTGTRETWKVDTGFFFVLECWFSRLD